MAILGILVGVLALVATIWGAVFSRGQLREAKAIRAQNERTALVQMEEDNLWAEKQVRAATMLCRIADLDKLPMFGSSTKIIYMGGTLSAIFPEDVRKQILGQLIERQHDDSYAVRPIDTSQLRLKATRDLIDLVLETIEKIRKQKPHQAKDLGL
jgi:hypothetical protein